MWFRNFYHCGDCGTSWEDEWSCCCDDECPNCGSSDWSPYESEDLSVIVEKNGTDFLVLHSPLDVQEHNPYYRLVATLSSSQLAASVAAAIADSTAPSADRES
jgi:hypothetical protein